MEVSESEGISHSYSHQNDEGNLYKMDSKTNLKKVLGIDYFENQSTLKQNMEFLKENVDYDEEIIRPVSDNLNILGQRPVESRRQKHRRIEYR
jgi:acetone carboxylase gamma subunit